MSADEHPEARLSGQDVAEGAARQPPPTAGPQAAKTAAQASGEPVIPEELRTALAKLNYRQGQQLSELRRSFEQFGKSARESAEWQALQELLTKNRQHQKELRQHWQTRLTALREALDEGRSRDALELWNELQDNIQQCTGKLRQAMEEAADSCKSEVLELHKWRTYAATEKKKQLIGELRELGEQKLAPAELSRRIQQCHDRWKALGQSEQNAKLWREFKRISDRLYEPCREHFRERKQRMANNLKVRTELCETLEQKVAQIEGQTSQPVHIVKLQQTISESNASWKQHAPVEHGKIKPLQKRYYAAIKRLAELRKEAIATNASGKRSCLERAKKLAKAEDREHAAAEARKLQAEWKRFGPAGFRIDKLLRQEFDKLCAAIFAALAKHQAEAQKRSKPMAERRHEALLEQLAPRMELLEELESSLFDADGDAAFAAARESCDDAWAALPAINEAAGRELERWRQELLEAANPAALAAAAGDREQALHRVCVQLEIDAGVNSPKDDHSLRMALQLEQLARGFGKRGPDQKELVGKLREAELSLAHGGPLQPATRRRLRERLGKLRQRISSRPPRSRGGS